MKIPMPNKPQFNYFLSNIKNQVQKNSKIWKSSIPVSRKQPKETSGFFFVMGIISEQPDLSFQQTTAKQ